MIEQINQPAVIESAAEQNKAAAEQEKVIAEKDPSSYEAKYRNLTGKK
jgi:hypothetical protein